MTNKSRPSQEKNSWLKHLDFIVLDILALIISYSIAYRLRFGELDFFIWEEWKNFTVIICLLDFVVILFTGNFSGVLRRHGSEELVSTLLNAVYNFILCCIILYVLHIGIEYSRLTVVFMYIIYTAISLLFREVWKRSLYRISSSVNIVQQKTILVVGKRADLPQLLRSINSGFFLEYTVKAVCVIDGEPGEKITTVIDLESQDGGVQQQVLEFENNVRLEEIASHILKEHIDELFVNVSPTELDPEIYRTLIENGKGIHLNIMPMIGFTTDDQFISTVGTNKTLGVGLYSFSGKQSIYLAVKRAIDICFGVVGAVCMLPLTLLVKLCYLCTGDTKSIFYTQTRLGINGQPFTLYKYRTMVYNAEELLPEILANNEALRTEWEENQKIENDPRITPIGRLLRKSSFDEVPQFINVLRGEMSLVGPRPLVEGELESHNGLDLYQLVKPGITGWWGCNGRSNTTYDERLELEYYYVKNCSMNLDLLCIIKTIKVILKGKGAK